MGIEQDAEQWLVKVACKKAIIKGVTVVVAWVGSGAVAGLLAHAGVTVDQVKLQEYLTGAALVALKAGEDYINLKYGTNI